MQPALRAALSALLLFGVAYADGDKDVPPKPKKVAVLGGGLGSIASVYYMTNYTGWEKDWDITVYQMGWRLGGKAATGRTMSDVTGSRILEHGLHMFFSGYDNAFMWVREMFAAWDRPADHPFQTVDDAFKASCNTGVYADMTNLSQPADYAAIEEADPLAAAWECLYTRVPPKLQKAPTPLGAFKAFLRGVADRAPPVLAADLALVLAAVEGVKGAPGEVLRDMLLGTLRPLQTLVKDMVDTVEKNAKAGKTGKALPGLWPPPGWCNAGKTELPETHAACEVFFWRATWMEVTAVIGVLADNTLKNGCGWEPVASDSLTSWLCRHNGPCNLRQDDLVRGLGVDGPFALVNGKLNQANFSIANVLCDGGLMRLGQKVPGMKHTSAAAFAYRMQAGMGEILFTPAYEILKKRGVKFHFFHKVAGLHTTDGETVDAIDVDVQATVAAGAASYDPLFEVQGLKVWPDLSAPAACDGCERFFSQLKERDAVVKQNINLESYYAPWRPVERKRLLVGTDFDIVINGITSGALPYVSQGLAAKNPAWAKFLGTTWGVATVAVQMWLYNTTTELGFKVPAMDPSNPSRTEPMFSSGPEPLDTWADMTHLMKYETSNASATKGGPQTVLYFCSPIEFDTTPGSANFSNASLPALQTERAFHAAAEWMEKHAHEVFPDWAAKGLYESLVAPPHVRGRDRLRYQFLRVNYEPTEQYVLSLGGTIEARPVPWAAKAGDLQPFKNMGVAGSHTRNGINCGAAEAAIASGLMLSHGVTNGRSPRVFKNYGQQNKVHTPSLLPAVGDYYPLAGSEEEALMLAGDTATQAHLQEGACPHGPAAQGGTLVADVVTVPFPRDAVERMLPKDVALADPLENPVPITFSFGSHTSVCNNAKDQAWLDGRAFNLEYDEFAMTIPGVKIRNPKPTQKQTPFTFVHRTYLSDPIAMVVGWSLSMTDKVTARFGHTANNTRAVFDFVNSNETLVSMTATATGNWSRYAAQTDVTAAKQTLGDLLTAPQLGYPEAAPGTGAKLFAVCVDRGADVSGVRVQPIAGTLQTFAGVDVVAPFEFKFDGTSAYRMVANWTMGMPNDCTPVAGELAAAAKEGRDRSEWAAGLPQPVFKTQKPKAKAKTPKRDERTTCEHGPGLGGGGGRNVFDMYFMLAETAVVEKILPEGVRLPKALRALPLTTISWAFLDQIGVCDNSYDPSWLDGRAFVMNYNEFAIMIPDVEIEAQGAGQPSRFFAPRLFLDHIKPTVIGWGFGIDKVLAHFDRDRSAGTWSIQDWNTREEMILVHSKNVSGVIPIPEVPKASKAAHLALRALGLAEGVEPPPGKALGLSGRGYGDDPHGQGFYICCNFEMKMGDHATVQLIEGDLTVRRPIDNGRLLKPFHAPKLIGMRLNSNWTMSYPDDCTPQQNGAGAEQRDAARRDAWVELTQALMAEDA